MSRVDAEGDSRGVRGRKQGGAQVKSKLRRAAIEWLERRELLSTAAASLSNLPAPVVVIPPNLGAAVSTGENITPTASAISPSVAIDPVNPKKVVAVWTYNDTASPFNPGALNTISSYVEGAYSTDGGVTWTPLGWCRQRHVQTDFSLTQTNGRQVFTENSDGACRFRSQREFLHPDVDAQCSGIGRRARPPAVQLCHHSHQDLAHPDDDEQAALQLGRD